MSNSGSEHSASFQAHLFNVLGEKNMTCNYRAVLQWLSLSVLRTSGGGGGRGATAVSVPAADHRPFEI